MREPDGLENRENAPSYTHAARPPPHTKLRAPAAQTTVTPHTLRAPAAQTCCGGNVTIRLDANADLDLRLLDLQTDITRRCVAGYGCLLSYAGSMVHAGMEVRWRADLCRLRTWDRSECG